MLEHKSLITIALMLVSIMISGCSQSDGNSTSETSSWTPNTEVSEENSTQESSLDVNATKVSAEDNVTQTPEVMYGHTLPPEPDPVINNSTLLGIDSNNNGVRDDVERWIYTTYDKPIEHAVMMQSARAYQIVIQEPEKALENLHYMHDASDCRSYWRMSEEEAKSMGEVYWLEEYRDYPKEIHPVQFNTAERFLAYDKYNQTLSGGVYSSSNMDEWKSKCEFNASNLTKAE